MAYLDYSPVEIADQTEGVRRLGDALTDIMKRKQEREQFQQKMKFEQDQETRRYAQQKAQYDYLNSIEERKNRMAEIEFNQRQQEHNAARAERARHAATPQEAEAIVNDTVTYDPHTGKEIGRGKLTPGPLRDIGPEPEKPVAPEVPAKEMGNAIPDILQAMPGMPPELAARMRGKTRPQPEADALVGPIPSAEEAKRAELHRIGTEPPSLNEPDVESRLKAVEDQRSGDEIKRRRFESQMEAYNYQEPTIGPAQAALDRYGVDKGAYDEASRAFPGQRAAYASDKRHAENERPYTMSFGPNDKGTTFDFETQRYAARKDAAERFLESLPPNMSETDRAAAAQIHAGLMSGTIEPSKAGAMFQRERMGIAAEGGKNSRSAANNATTLEAAKIRANAPHMDWKETVGRGNLALGAEREGNNEFERYLRNAGYKADFATMKDLIDTNESLKVGNSALDVTAGAQFAKKAQGAGVLTDKDYDRFWAAIGGGEARPEDWFEMVIDGRMGEKKRRIVVGAISHKVDAENGRLRSMATQADMKFGNEPWYPGTRAAYFSFVPGLPPMGQAAGPRIGTSGVPRKGAPPEIKKRLKAKGTAVDRALDLVEGGQ